MSINYMQAYTDLRPHKLDFHKFMGIINKVYEYGYSRGRVDGINECQQALKKQEDVLLSTEHQKN